MKKKLPLFLFVPLLLIFSCTKADTKNISSSDNNAIKSDNKGSAEQEKVFSAISEKSVPWYSEKLEAIGFYVFPEPQAFSSFSVLNLNGKATSVESLLGKVVLLNFWATWCPPCRSEMPTIEILNNTMKDKNFAIMAISVGEKHSTVSDFLKSSPYTFPVYLDETGAVSRSFVGQGIPTTFILNKQGEVIAGVIGALSYSDPSVVEVFKNLAEKL